MILRGGYCDTVWTEEDTSPHISVLAYTISIGSRERKLFAKPVQIAMNSDRCFPLCILQDLLPFDPCIIQQARGSLISRIRRAD